MAVAAQFKEWNGTTLIPLTMFDNAGYATSRKNWSLDPQALTSTRFGYYVSSGEVGTTTYVTNASDGPTSLIKSYGRRTVTTAKTSGSTGWGSQNIAGYSRTDVSGISGDVVSNAIWVRYTGTGTLKVRLRNYLVKPDGVNLLSKDSPSYTLISGQWTLIVGSVTATAPFSYSTWWLYSDLTEIAEAGATIDATGSRTEINTIISTTHYDGSTESVPGVVTYSWEGTPNASPSIEQWAKRVQRRNLLAFNYSVSVGGHTTGGSATFVRDTAWSSNGRGGSIRINTASASSTSTSVYPFGITNANVRIGMVPGRTYTFGATVRLVAAQTGSLHAVARGLTVGSVINGVTNFEYAVSNGAPNAAGVTRQSVTFTVPLDATNMFFRYMNGEGTTAQGGSGGSVWWDAPSLVEGTEDSYFDGTSADTGGYLYRWVGTPGLSQSVEFNAYGTALTAVIV